MIQTMFVDFGNVCATFDFHRFIENFSKATKVPPKEIEATLQKKTNGCKGYWGYSPLFEAFESGEIGSTEFFRTLSVVLGCSRKINYLTFVDIWTDVFCQENAALDKLLGELPQQMCLLSNTNELVYKRYIARCAITQNHFPRERRFLSFRIGAIKPDPRIYIVALAKANAKPEESLFIDDISENIEAWRALGGVGIVYDARKDSITGLRKKLRALGVLR